MADDNEIIRTAHLVLAMDRGEGSENELQRAFDAMTFNDKLAVLLTVKLSEGRPYRYCITTSNPETFARARSIAGLLGAVSSIETDGDRTIIVFSPPVRN